MFEFAHLEKSMAAVGALASNELFDELNKYYSDDTRFYHDKSHIVECLRNFQLYRSKAEHPSEIEIAIWFHDVIYDTKASDNEEQSAVFAERALVEASAQKDSVNRVVDMILATKTHQVSSNDSKLMVDIDLGILGTPRDVFEQYDQNIRKEYHWVPSEVYLPGRANVLRSFIEREAIYHTKEFYDLYEVQARKNLERKIAELTA